MTERRGVPPGRKPHRFAIWGSCGICAQRVWVIKLDRDGRPTAGRAHRLSMQVHTAYGALRERCPGSEGEPYSYLDPGKPW